MVTDELIRVPDIGGAEGCRGGRSPGGAWWGCIDVVQSLIVVESDEGLDGNTPTTGRCCGANCAWRLAIWCPRVTRFSCWPRGVR